MLKMLQWLQAAVCFLFVSCRQWPVVSASQVMAPLLDNNHELNWQANMVDAIERKTANQHTEGESFVAPLNRCSCSYNKKTQGQEEVDMLEDGISRSLSACLHITFWCMWHSRTPF